MKQKGVTYFFDFDITQIFEKKEHLTLEDMGHLKIKVIQYSSFFTLPRNSCF